MSAYIKLTEGYMRGQPKGRLGAASGTQQANGQVKGSASGYSPRPKAEVAPPPPLQPRKHNDRK